MSRQVRFADLDLIVPEGWLDLTEDLPEGSPSTLARSGGLGALQFSTYMYRSGALPHIRIEDLRGFLGQFGKNHDLGEPVATHEGGGETSWVAGDYASEREFIRVWHVTNGRDLAMVTYVCQETGNPQWTGELAEASDIVQSARF